MAEEQSKGIQQIEGCEVIYDMGSGLVIAKVPLDKVKEQDINARIMMDQMQDQLTANIKKRGQLESLPLFVLIDGKLEIISGHHRVKSARAAEMKEIVAIVDVSGLSRSKIAAKQLAHNAISGFDDGSTLREIVKMIDDVDDMIESFVGKEIMEEPMKQYNKMLSPAVQFDFKNVTFTFLPHQVNDMDILVKDLESKAPEIVGVASYEQCKGLLGRTNRCRRHYYSCRYVPVCEGRKCNHIKRMRRDLLRDGFIKEAVSMMLSLQNSINSRNGPGGNKNRSVWLRVGVTGVAFQAVNQPCGTQGPLAKSAVAGYLVRETVQIADSGYGVSFRIKACGQKRRLM